MAQGREGRAVPVKQAQEKDQPPAAERSESREKARPRGAGRGETQQTSVSERWDEANP